MTSVTDERAPLRGCDGCAVEPAELPPENRPGLPALQYRLGTWSTFLARMLTQVPKQTVTDGTATFTPLETLNRRAADDPAVALLDAYAVVCDVLTFYQERIANEGFLRTATERRSVLELARAIGYELGPGVAASTYLAFTVDPTPTAPTSAAVPSGSQVRSVPAPGQLPQTFETIEDIVARVQYNALRPLLTQPQSFDLSTPGLVALRDLSGTISTAATHLFLAGTNAGLKVGDLLLASDGTTNLPVHVLGVTVDNVAQQTIVRIAPGDPPAVPPLPSPVYPPPATTGVIELDPLPLAPDVVAAKVVGKVWDEQSLAAFCAIQRWDPFELVTVVAGILAAQTASSSLFAFRQRLACFGHNAPPYAQVRLEPVPDPNVIKGVLDWYASSINSESDFQSLEADMAAWIAYELTTQPYPDPNDWDQNPRSVWQDSHGNSWRTSSRPFDIFLERAVSQVVAGGWALLEHSGGTQAYAITGTEEETLADFALTGRATGLALDTSATGKDGTFLVRQTAVNVQSESLPLAPLPIVDLIETSNIEGQPSGAGAIQLGAMLVGLQIGQALLVTGIPVGDDGTPTGLVRSEAVILSACIHASGYTTLYFEKALKNRYVRASVTIAANVARATHGETVPREILGSGDASQDNQRFTLQKPPLTWVTAATPSGRASTLTVRVNDTEWTEVPSFYSLPPDARAYTLRTGDDGRTTVAFGDGSSGARLPTGTGNVVATYRSGIGLDGQVPAGSLTVLMSRPTGIAGVNNPLAADGAADRESADDARTNAPVTVLTLGRIVSLRDYESFTRAFAGVGKAQAVALWDGHAQRVHITVAAADGSPLDTTSALYDSLTKAIRSSSDGIELVQVDGFTQRYFRVEATVVIDPTADPESVLPAVEVTLHATFDFASRSFGQRVTFAEVTSAIQGVTGVVACTITTLVALTGSGGDVGSGVSSILPAAVAHWESGSVALAELLLLYPTGVKLTQGDPP
jgi:hypothetical protein